MKNGIKALLAETQGQLDVLTGRPLQGEGELIDTDRITPKANGGTYDDLTNVRVLNPRSHMERHGNLRRRSSQLDEIKSAFDARQQLLRLRVKIENQKRAWARGTDHERPDVADMFDEQLDSLVRPLAKLEREIKGLIEAYEDPLAQVALDVPRIGPITVCGLTVYIDLEKAPHASSLWRYVGYDRPAHERYEKGRSGGGNKTLRTIMYNCAMAMVRDVDSPYRSVYDRDRARRDQSEKLVKSRNTQGNMVTVAWKDTKASHRHGAALRLVAKHILADYWFVGRTLRGLPTSSPYAHAQLGHPHVINPRERGWKW